MTRDTDTWAEVDLGAIAGNVRALRGLTTGDCRFMAVVKADGYGHGAVETARASLEAGADRLAVARTHEGVELREAGIDAPILVFGPTPAARADALWRFDLAQSVSSVEAASAIADAARGAGAAVTVHVKVDTGMGRMGILPDCGAPGAGRSPADAVLAIDRLSALRVEGIYTHFASADGPDKTFSRLQLEIYLDFLEALRRVGYAPPIRHAANSAALIDLPESHLDMVRPGIALYGLYPSADVDRTRVALTPAMTLKSTVIHVKAVPPGFPVSYGSTWEAGDGTRIATVPVGYADGIQRRLSNAGWMLVRGKRAPIAGRVCMDLTMLDVGRVDGVCEGDEVVVMGRQGEAAFTADDMADLLGTINYEVVFTNGRRVPRVYRR